VLKQGSSFDYVSENRSFSDADDYTLSITLPLAGCSDNLEIFGHVDRMDVDSRHIVLPASIVDRNFSKNGIITVVEATDVEVKCQFLADRSVQNFMTTFDDIYVNEMNLGSYPQTLPQYVSHGDIDHGSYFVALPWWNEEAKVMNNEVIIENGSYKWADSTKSIGKLSYMPYLIEIAKRICGELDYSFDFAEWEDSDEKYLIICNVLPASWDIPQIARALPHWTVSEFFAELEKILVCEINIDHRVRHIELKFTNNVDSAKETVKIDDVLDSFSSEISYEDDICRFKGIANLRYADRGDEKWKFEQCQWFVDLMKTDGKYYKEFQTESDYWNWYTAKFGLLGPWPAGKDEERGPDVGMLIHIVESDRYGMWRVIYGNSSEYPNRYYYEWIDLSRFSDVIKDPDSDNDLELQMIPACIRILDLDYGSCLFMSPSNYNESEDYDSDGIRQPMAYSNFLKGEQSSAAEYYDKIMLAYWDGHSANDNQYSPDQLLPPCPYVDERFSLKSRYKDYLSGHVVNPREKMKISWISSAIPDVRSVFNIRGKRYLCEKITATFTENGMSQLLKGGFYSLLDD
ncbi:MAG: hypothetical protein K2N91_06075, partial [Muribaculaceae bacterium]|nr:hypothetical protein [Muribaculaceae bacterium]